MTTVTFDAVSHTTPALATSGNTGTTMSWDHTFGATATALLISIDGGPSDITYWTTGIGKSYTEFGRSITVGGVPMQLLEIHDLWSGHVDGWVSVWGLVGSSIAAFAGTTQTIVVNEAYALDGSIHYPVIHGAAVSYSGAASFTHGGYTGNAQNPSASIASGVGHMVYASYGGSFWGGYSSTPRYNFGNTHTNHYEALLIIDGPGASPSASLQAFSTDSGAVAVAIVDIAPLTGPPPVITITELDAMTQGVSFSQTLLATNTPTSWSVPIGSLPAGLTLNSVTGEISGTPTTSGAYDFTARATNTYGNGDQRFTGVVSAIPVIPFIPDTVSRISVKLNGHFYPVHPKIRITS